MSCFYSLDEYETAPTENPTLTVSGDGWDRAPYSSTMERVMTVEEMLAFGAELTTRALQIQEARRNTPDWEKQSYSVG